ncbi:hypothetical protein T492DRAFT_1042709 [Pavlovales sp. CCMP2436]|nr:hypothetical protein T492DRAFT_1042709 [Pavlovales sp. CCMP2436]
MALCLALALASSGLVSRLLGSTYGPPRDMVVYEEPFTTSGLCHLPAGRYRYKFGERADAFVDAFSSQRDGCFGQLTCDAWGTPLAVGVLARVAASEPCADISPGRMVTLDFGTRFVPDEVIQESPHKVLRGRPLHDPWRLIPMPGSDELRRDVQRLTVRVAELRQRLAGDGSAVPLNNARAVELGRQLLRPWDAELLSFAALGLSDVPLLAAKGLLVSIDTRARLIYAHEALDPLAKELEAKAVLQSLFLSAGAPPP